MDLGALSSLLDAQTCLDPTVAGGDKNEVCALLLSHDAVLVGNTSFIVSA